MAKMAIGFLECAGYATVLYAMDKACKAADVGIIGVDTINPKDTSAFIPMTAQVKFTGTVSNVQVAAEAARQAALRFNDEKEVLTEYNPAAILAEKSTSPSAKKSKMTILKMIL